MGIKKSLTKTWDNICERTGFEFIKMPLRYASDENEVTLAVPGYRQTKSYSCGYVAGLMVLHTFYPKKSVTKFYCAVNPHRDWGTSTTKLIKALRMSGVGIARKTHVSFEELKNAINQGFPILTAIKRTRDIEHWVAIFGVGVEPNRIFLAGNSTVGGHVMTWPMFKKIWNTEREILVCWGAK